MTKERLAYIRGCAERAERRPVTTMLLELLGHIDQREKWIADLKSGMYINCVYCGHRYGRADVLPASKAEILKRHIAECPEHPMSSLLEASRAFIRAMESAGCGQPLRDALLLAQAAIEKAEGKS